MKKLLSLLLTVCMLVTICSDIRPVQAETTAITGLSAMEITNAMGFGINIGNSLDATGTSAWNNKTGNAIYNQETSWGNPIVTKELFTAIKKKGFTCVRIPITWEFHISDDGKYTVDSAWMKRVKEVVDYAYDLGLYVIINTHHDTWTEWADLANDYEKIGIEMQAVWSQIAKEFANYDQRLIFEGMNEPTNVTLSGTKEERDWVGASADYQAVNYLNQVFVDTVRQNGEGYNSERLLMVQGYAASSSSEILETISIPTYNGGSAGNIAISLHCYTPYNFCGSGTKTTFDSTNSEDTASIDRIFDTILKRFLCYGIPVIFGEAGASNFGHTSAHENWYNYVSFKAAAYGTPLIFWDNGINGQDSENYGLIDRVTCGWNSASLMKQIFAGKKKAVWGSAVLDYDASASNVSCFDSDFNVIASYEGGISESKLWTEVTGSEVDAKEGKDYLVVYTGERAPQLIYHDADWSWVCVDEAETKAVSQNGKEYNLAYFTSEDILKALNRVNYDGCRGISFRAMGSAVTIYEICEDANSLIFFRSNGSLYSVGSTLPSNPSWGTYTFKGWYTTPDYQAGTELTAKNISKISGECTAYAKFAYSSSLKPDKTTLKLMETSTGVKLKWTKVDDATGYIIYRAEGDGAFKKVKTIKKGSTLTWTDTKAVKNDVKYRYKIVTYRTFAGKTYKSAASKIAAIVK